MKELKQRIMKEREDLGNGVLKVDGFLNHEVDAMLSFFCGRELTRYFSPFKATKVLAAEISGMAPALMTALELKIPVVFAHKHRPITMSTDISLTTVPSHTKESQASSVWLELSQ